MTGIHWKLRFDNLKKAFARLEEACAQEEYSNLELAGLVQTYQFTFELCWKTLKDLITSEGFDVNSPKTTIKKAFALSLIHDVDGWLEALDDRNKLCHTYDEPTAQQAMNTIKTEYMPLLRECIALLKERENEE